MDARRQIHHHRRPACSHLGPAGPTRRGAAAAVPGDAFACAGSRKRSADQLNFVPLFPQADGKSTEKETVIAVIERFAEELGHESSTSTALAGLEGAVSVFQAHNTLPALAETYTRYSFSGSGVLTSF